MLHAKKLFHSSHAFLSLSHQWVTSINMFTDSFMLSPVPTCQVSPVNSFSFFHLISALRFLSDCFAVSTASFWSAFLSVFSLSSFFSNILETPWELRTQLALTLGYEYEHQESMMTLLPEYPELLHCPRNVSLPYCVLNYVGLGCSYFGFWSHLHLRFEDELKPLPLVVLCGLTLETSFQVGQTL